MKSKPGGYLGSNDCRVEGITNEKMIGRNVPRVLNKQQGGLCGWSTVRMADSAQGRDQRDREGQIVWSLVSVHSDELRSQWRV